MAISLATIGLLAGLSAAAGLFNTGMSHIQRNTDRAYNSAEAQKQRDFNAAEAEKTRAFNSAEAQKQRDFEQTMSSTAVQRQVADMKEAGINPTLSASLGGASTPSGGMASTGYTPGGASASSGGSYDTGVSGIMNSASNLINSITKIESEKLQEKYVDQVMKITTNHTKKGMGSKSKIDKSLYDNDLSKIIL